MQLYIEPFYKIQESSSKRSRHRSQSAEPASPTPKYNTSHHTVEEIGAQVPEVTHIVPPPELYKLSQWIPLLARSQKMEKYHILSIDKHVWRQLELCRVQFNDKKFVPTKVVGRAAEVWKSSTLNVSVVQDLHHEARLEWFVRLDQSGVRDTKFSPRVKSFKDLIRKLVSSERAWQILEKDAKLVEENDVLFSGEDKDTLDTKVILTLWYDDINDHSDKSFQVFVPPHIPDIRPRMFKISAISQCQWTGMLTPYNGKTIYDAVDAVYDFSRELLKDIGSFARLELDKKDIEVPRDTEGRPIEIPILPNGVLAQLLRYGFCFDVTLLPDNKPRWTGIKPFGAMSGTGSCLFHWIKDADILYDRYNGPVNFLITADFVIPIKRFKPSSKQDVLVVHPDLDEILGRYLADRSRHISSMEGRDTVMSLKRGDEGHDCETSLEEIEAQEEEEQQLKLALRLSLAGEKQDAEKQNLELALRPRIDIEKQDIEKQDIEKQDIEKQDNETQDIKTQDVKKQDEEQNFQLTIRLNVAKDKHNVGTDNGTGDEKDGDDKQSSTNISSCYPLS